MCLCVCLGRIIRPCALLPQSSLTTGLSHNEATLSRTQGCYNTHTQAWTLYRAHSQMFENKHAHIITHTLCKCLTEIEIERERETRLSGDKRERGRESN